MLIVSSSSSGRRGRNVSGVPNPGHVLRIPAPRPAVNPVLLVVVGHTNGGCDAENVIVGIPVDVTVVPALVVTPAGFRFSCINGVMVGDTMLAAVVNVVGTDVTIGSAFGTSLLASAPAVVVSPGACAVRTPTGLETGGPQRDDRVRRDPRCCCASCRSISSQFLRQRSSSSFCLSSDWSRTSVAPNE